jgi:hypothetical protein
VSKKKTYCLPSGTAFGERKKPEKLLAAIGAGKFSAV